MARHLDSNMTQIARQDKPAKHKAPKMIRICPRVPEDLWIACQLHAVKRRETLQAIVHRALVNQLKKEGVAA